MNLKVSSSPHVSSNETTTKVMLHVIIALMPALAASIYFFGLRALAVVLITVLASVIFEYLSCKIMKRKNSISDLSAVVTGILLAFCLSPMTPVWIFILGAFIAIVIAKQMFGGLGNNFVNPAILARLVLALSFLAPMNKWVIAPSGGAFSGFMSSVTGADLVATATPLAPNVTEIPSYLNLFLGVGKAGSLGEISVAALLLGGIYLLAMGVIKIWIPLSFFGGVTLMTLIAGQDLGFHLLAGGLFLGAFFMATDYVTSPLTNTGKIIFGLGCGLITGLIRFYGNLPEGVAFSILFMNILTPHIDRLTVPKPFGGGSKRAKQKA